MSDSTATSSPTHRSFSIQVGPVEESLLVNTSGVDHVFHVHPTDFAVLRVGSGANATRREQDKSPSLHVVTRLGRHSARVERDRPLPRQPQDFGKYVFHCHILPHEDGGMMMGVIALPNSSQRRFAPAPPQDEPAQVVLEGRQPPQNRRSSPGGWPPRHLDGDRRADRGPDRGHLDRPGNAGRSPVHLGLRRPDARAHAGTFTRMRRPFGLSLAVGNIDDQRTGEIIVGEVGPGPSSVGIWRPDGSFVRMLWPDDPGNAAERRPGPLRLTSTGTATTTSPSAPDAAIRGRRRHRRRPGLTSGTTTKLFSFGRARRGGI